MAEDPTNPLAGFDDDGDLFDFDELIEGAEGVAESLSSELEEALDVLDPAPMQEEPALDVFDVIEPAPTPEEPALVATPEPVPVATPDPASVAAAEPIPVEAPDPAPRELEPIPAAPAMVSPLATVPAIVDETRSDEGDALFEDFLEEEPAEEELAPQAARSRVQRNRRPAPNQLRISPVLAAALAFMVVANLALIGFVWGSIGSADEATAEVDELEPSEAPAPIAVIDVEMPRNLSREVPRETLGRSRSDAYAVLDDVRFTLEAGRYERARRTAYGLLSVIDRVAPDDRADIEARAGLLIAESYRLEARSLSLEEGA